MSDHELEKQPEMEKLDDAELLAMFELLQEELEEVTVSEDLIRNTLAAAEEMDEQKEKQSTVKMPWFYLLATMAALFAVIYLGSAVGRQTRKDSAAPESSVSMECSGSAMPENAGGNIYNAGSTATGDRVTDGEWPGAKAESAEGDLINPSEREDQADSYLELENAATAEREEPTQTPTCSETEERPRDAATEEVVEGVSEAENVFANILRLCGYDAAVEAVRVVQETDATILYAQLENDTQAECRLYAEDNIELRIMKEDGSTTVVCPDSRTGKAIWELWQTK